MYFWWKINSWTFAFHLDWKVYQKDYNNLHHSKRFWTYKIINNNLLCRSFQSPIVLIGQPWSIRKLNEISKLNFCTVSIILEGVSCFLFRLKSDSFQSRLFFSHWGLWLFAQFHDWGDRSVFGGVHDCSWFVYPFKSLKSIRKWPDSIPHRTIQ